MLEMILIGAAYVFLALVVFIYVAPKKATQMALNAERKRAGLTSKSITLDDGLNYAYLEGGQGEPLLLLHGFGGNKDTFTRVAHFLTPHYRVIIPDVIGFGDSSHPALPTDYSVGAQVERVRSFCQALDLHKLHLAGNSMGGQIALLHAALYPDEVLSLWLLAPAGLWSAEKSDLMRAFSETAHNPLIARDVKEFKKVMALGMVKPPFIPRPMLKVLAGERIENADLEEHIFQQLLNCSVEQQVDGLETKTLIVFGAKDRVIPVETATVLSQLLPNSQSIILPEVGHVAMFENPQQCADDYLVFRGDKVE